MNFLWKHAFKIIFQCYAVDGVKPFIRPYNIHLSPVPNPVQDYRFTAVRCDTYPAGVIDSLPDFYSRARRGDFHAFPHGTLFGKHLSRHKVGHLTSGGGPHLKALHIMGNTYPDHERSRGIFRTPQRDNEETEDRQRGYKQRHRADDPVFRYGKSGKG